MTLGDLLASAVAARPDAVALMDAPNRPTFADGEPRRLTWAEFDVAVERAAAALGELGVSAGGRVAIQLPNVVELPVLLLACSRLGAVAVPFPIQHRAHELRHGFDSALVVVAITADRPDRPDNLATVAKVAAEYGAVALSVDALHRTEPSAERPGRTPPAVTDIATICWTSGTTGTPKGVPRTHAMWGETGCFQVDAFESHRRTIGCFAPFRW